ncbi:hypothetical protein SAP269_18750 [Spiroplasma ixodetis]|uniref:Uncharacterized protein n=1 Tax=Spiroplasma ixodetis TaxID=2141 RepID=A0ABM8JTU3_9MOLU
MHPVFSINCCVNLDLWNVALSKTIICPRFNTGISIFFTYDSKILLLQCPSNAHRAFNLPLFSEPIWMGYTLLDTNYVDNWTN